MLNSYDSEVSVIIPCHNNVTTLDAILATLAKPQSVALEVICVDDASTVDLQPILHKYAVRYLRLPNGYSGRRAAARQAGHKVARAPISLYIDGDVIPEPRILLAAIRLHRKHTRAVMKYPVYSIPESLHRHALKRIIRLVQNHRIPELGPVLARILSADQGRLPRRLHNARTELWPLCASNCFSVEKRYIDQIGGWDEEFVGWGEEDMELMFRLWRHGLAFFFPDRRQAAAYHLDHPVNWASNLQQLSCNVAYFRRKWPRAWQIRRKFLYNFLCQMQLDGLAMDLGILDIDSTTSVSNPANGIS